jgi:uncharacterized protein (DUF1330 family)
MTDIPVYILANFTVTDAATYRVYEKGFFPLLKRYGGEFITYDDTTETLEGKAPPPGRIVIFKFPSEAAAKSWWADPEYQALSEHRRNGTDGQFVTLVHGLPSRG